MEHPTLSANVEAIRQAFSYVDRFRDKLFVIKVADSLVSHPLFPLLIRDIVLLHRMGIKIVLVPGARTRIDEVLRTFNIHWTSHDGTRISSSNAMPYIKMAASDVANRIMTLLAEHDANAVVGNWVKARSIGVREGVDYQSSGLVESIQSTVVTKTLENGLIPIFPNVGWGPKGRPYNISSDQLALTVSRELGAAKLFFITDFVPLSRQRFSVPEGADVAQDGTVSALAVDQARQFVSLNPSSDYRPEVSMIALAIQACQGGVPRVHIVDGRAEGALLGEVFSNRGIGTMVYANRHANVRPMVRTDIPDILRLMQPLVREGKLVARTEEDLEQSLRDYVVHEVDGTVHGCGALHRLSVRQGEIAGLVVNDSYGSKGIGKTIISSLLDRAQTLGLKRVFVLTTQAADWFLQLGFRDCAPTDLPKQRQKRYDTQRRSRVLLYDILSTRVSPRLQVE